MRALTVRQPYANLLVEGIKRVENRGYRTGQRGTVVVHSAAKVHDRYRGQTFTPLGAFVGTVRLVESHQSHGHECVKARCHEHAHAEWPHRALGQIATPVWHWLVVEPVAFVTPIPAKGALGFWTPTDSDEYLIDLAVSEAQQKREATHE